MLLLMPCFADFSRFDARHYATDFSPIFAICRYVFTLMFIHDAHIERSARERARGERRDEKSATRAYDTLHYYA